MARKYFFPHNTCDCSAEDLTIMNRCGRMVADMTRMDPPQFTKLADIRQRYRPGMNAQELFDLVMGMS